MQYSDFIKTLQSYAEEEFAIFQRSLIPTKRTIMGVRTPTLRRLAKTYKGNLDELFAYPNEYYETVFIKLVIVASLPYNQFIKYLEPCVRLIDNWALCDSFKCTAISHHKKDFLPILDKLFTNNTEFYQRYVLVTLLYYYLETEDFSIVQAYIKRANTQKYYVYMAVAWLVAEVLVKHYDNGLTLLQSIQSDTKTYNKAIQKAIESFRISKEQKETLRSLKIK